MTTTHGADPEQLQQLARTFDRQAAALREAEHALSAMVAGLLWRGWAAERFCTAWQGGQGARLVLAATGLQAASKDLDRQAAEQHRASGAGGGGLAVGVFGPGSTTSSGGGFLTSVDVGRGDSGDPLFERKLDPATLLDRKYGDQDDEATAKAAERRLDADVTLARGEVGAEAHVARAETSGEFQTGPLAGTGDASVDLLQAKAGADGEVTIGRDGLQAKGGASAAANLVAVQATGSLSAYGLTLANTSSASVGADATVDGRFGVGPTGLAAGGSVGAFVGGKAETSVSLGGGGVTATGGASVRYGLGAEASGDIDAGLDKVRVKANIGATLGLGGSVSFDVSVSPKDTVKSVGSGISKIGGWLR